MTKIDQIDRDNKERIKIFDDEIPKNQVYILRNFGTYIVENKKFQLIQFIKKVAENKKYSAYIRVEAFKIMQNEIIIDRSRKSITDICQKVIKNDLLTKYYVSTSKEYELYQTIIHTLALCEKNHEITDFLKELFYIETIADYRVWILDGINFLDVKGNLNFFFDILKKDIDEKVRKGVIIPILWNNLKDDKISWISDLEPHFTTEFVNSVIHDKSIDNGVSFINLIFQYSKNKVKKYEKILLDIIRNRDEHIHLRKSAIESIGKYAGKKTIIELITISEHEYELSYSVSKAIQIISQRLQINNEDLIKKYTVSIRDSLLLGVGLIFQIIAMILSFLRITDNNLTVTALNGLVWGIIGLTFVSFVIIGVLFYSNILPAFIKRSAERKYKNH